jgi:hypothetical protein
MFSLSVEHGLLPWVERPIKGLHCIVSVSYAGRCPRCQCLFLLTKAASFTEETIAASILRSIFGEGVIWVAIQPAFTRLSRRNHRVTSGVRVFGSVAIW